MSPNGCSLAQAPLDAVDINNVRLKIIRIAESLFTSILFFFLFKMTSPCLPSSKITSVYGVSLKEFHSG